MRRETADMAIGLILLIVGIIIMMSVFFMAMNLVSTAGDYFREQVPEEERIEGPEARFRWETNDLSVTFEDQSQEGDGDITVYEWDMGDGNPYGDPNPTHNYQDYGEYEVSLRIVDENDKSSSARGNVIIRIGNITSGTSRLDSEGGGFEADFGNVIIPIAIAILVGVLFVVMFAVGAAITKAGWNILKPKPEKLKIKLKPKEMEVIQVGTYAAPPREPPPQPIQQPPEDYSPPPPEEYQEQV